MRRWAVERIYGNILAMFKSMLRSAGWVYVMLLSVVWFVRVLSPSSSFPSAGSDYAAHMAIAFQTFDQPTSLLHWPVPYWGIVLAHVLCWPFLALGMDVSRAMLFVLDASWVSVVFGLWWFFRGQARSAAQRLALAGVLLAITVPGIFALALWGFYSQAVSMGFYVPALLGWIRTPASERLGWKIPICMMLGTFCYPDAFLWIAPLLIFSAQSILGYRRLDRALRVLFLMGWVVLVCGQMFKMRDDGGGSLVYSALFTGLTVIGCSQLMRMAHFSRPELRRIAIAFSVYMLVVLGMVLYSWVSFGEIFYYARKNLLASLYWLPLLVAVAFESSKTDRTVRRSSFFQGTAWLGLLVIALNWSGYLGIPFSRLYDGVLRARGAITPVDRATLVVECPDNLLPLMVPQDFSSSWNQIDARIARLVHANLRPGNVNIQKFSVCWQGRWLNYIIAGLEWEKQSVAISGRVLCGARCPP